MGNACCNKSSNKYRSKSFNSHLNKHESPVQSIEKTNDLKKKFELEFGNQKNIDKISFLKIYNELEINNVFYAKNQMKN